MRWTERQQRMLHTMGLRVWAPREESDAGTSEAAGASVALPQPPTPTHTPAPVAKPSATPPPARRPAAPVALADALATAAPQRPQAPAGEREARIATLDWPALRDTVAACEACALCQTRKHTVFGVGHEQAHWMIVGEAPGEQEDLQGEPFVGAAGQLLDAMLRAVQRSRLPGDDPSPVHQVYIANTLKCRPPRNRNPLPDELARCEPFLQRQIALIQPKLILAMGKFAIQQLLGSDEPVGRLRGKVHQVQGVPVVVTYHPAYLLRQLSEKAKTWDDLRLAMRVYDKVMARERA